MYYLYSYHPCSHRNQNYFLLLAINMAVSATGLYQAEYIFRSERAGKLRPCPVACRQKHKTHPAFQRPFIRLTVTLQACPVSVPIYQQSHGKQDGRKIRHAHVKLTEWFTTLPTPVRRKARTEAQGDTRSLYLAHMKCQSSGTSCVCFLSSGTPHPHAHCVQ